MAKRDGESHPSIGILRVASLHESGSLIELEDESRWEVSPGNELFTTHWSPRSRITVVPGGVASYPYDLINPESGDRVAARPIDPPGTGWSLVED
jgi:hypothetical protein